MGLFPCIFKRASSAVLTVVLGLCAADVHATKIEFSVPTSEVAVPDQQKELKTEAKEALKTEISFKGGLNVSTPVAPVVVVPVPNHESDPFALDQDKDKKRNDREGESRSEKRDNAALAEKYKAAQAAEAMRAGAQDSLSSSSWDVNRRSPLGRDASRDADSSFNPRERSVGWSTLFKEGQEERDRKEQKVRLNDFRALYETHNSMSPIGPPAATSDPMKESLWRDQPMNMHDNREQLYSRRDEAGYGQSTPGFRGGGFDSFGSGPSRNDFRSSDIAPKREFDQHRAVLEFPKKPGDLLK